MGSLEKVFLWFFQTSLTAAIIILIIILILKMFNNHISVRIKHGLWILVMLRLLVPVIPEANINLFDIFSDKYTNSLQEMILDTSGKNREISIGYNNYNNDTNKIEKINDYEKNKEEYINKQIWISNFIKIASLIWIIGIIVLSLTFILSLMRFKRKIIPLEIYEDFKIKSIINNLKDKLNINSKIQIFIYDGIKSPGIFGILKPKIYIPQYVLKIEDYNKLSYSLLHELMHYKRKDLYYNFLSIVALCIHWFNPLVWIAINKMKLYREYACDACVLECLEEKERIDYGMTLIDFSRMFFNKKEQSRLLICFENNNQIKRRIKMIKDFKKGSYKISTVAILSCLVATIAIFTNSIQVKGFDNDNVSEITSNKEENSKFLIDAPLKAYDDIKKAQEIAGFKFKVPDYILDGNEVGAGFQVIKVSDKENAVQMFFYNNNERNNEFSLITGVSDPIEIIKKSASAHHALEEDFKVESERNLVNFNGISGEEVTVTITSPERKIEDIDIVIKETKEINKYFVWKDSGIFYILNYNKQHKDQDEINQWTSIDKDNIFKIAKSLKYSEDIKNVNYSPIREVSTEIGVMSIYDKGDLEKAEKILGFNPKFPLKVDKDIKITGSGVGITGDSDIENNIINYEINNFYSGKNLRMTFTAKKDLKFYNNIKKNGYFINENTEDNVPKKINVQKLNINNNEVFKYEESNEYNYCLVYIWKENDVCYSIALFNEVDNPDKIAEEFVNSKSIY
ncbi:M56 family metallopeptidase [Clostridium botulinum]|nr:M56 family metallopeptidase [Clostridium botulinum]